MSDETPRLHIDSDWKAQAQAEKERLAAKESARNSRARRRLLSDSPSMLIKAIRVSPASLAKCRRPTSVD